MLCQRIHMFHLSYILFVYGHIIVNCLICLSADGVMVFCSTRFSPQVTSNGRLRGSVDVFGFIPFLIKQYIVFSQTKVLSLPIQPQTQSSNTGGVSVKVCFSSHLYFDGLVVLPGGSPYPRMDGRKIANLLQNGYRMPKPQHVDEKL